LVESICGGSKTTYAYDPLGRRVSKETDGVVTWFYWDGDALLGDVTGNDIREWIYYPGSFEPLVMIRNEEFYLYHNDPNGCPSRLLDESGKVVWAARYDAWGKVKRLGVDEVEQPLRLQGQYFDGETGLHYNRFRYYCAEIGSFVSQDPLGLMAGENVYGFGPNAQMWVDPLGLECKMGGVKSELPGRNGALNQAKRDANILRRKQPDKIVKVKMTEAKSRGGHVIKDTNGKIIEIREYHYTNRFNEKVIIQEHSAPHIGSDGPHFNVRPISDTRNGVFPGTKDHYPFKLK
jgi:RHS repeat-associated protein